MDKIRKILAAASLLVSVVFFAIFTVSVFFKSYDSMIWSGLISSAAFGFMLLISGIPDNGTYLKNLHR
jgi:hypothetical protein